VRSVELCISISLRIYIPSSTSLENLWGCNPLSRLVPSESTLPLCVDSKFGTILCTNGRNVGRHEQRIPQLSSTTDQYAAGALSQHGSWVLMPLCRVEMRTSEMVQVLHNRQTSTCLTSWELTRNLSRRDIVTGPSVLSSFATSEPAVRE
jgi:hypothetical protein